MLSRIVLSIAFCFALTSLFFFSASLCDDGVSSVERGLPADLSLDRVLTVVFQTSKGYLHTILGHIQSSFKATISGSQIISLQPNLKMYFVVTHWPNV